MCNSYHCVTCVWMSDPSVKYIALQGCQLSTKKDHPLELALGILVNKLAFIDYRLKTPSIPMEATF